jgi:hypothetical protein
MNESPRTAERAEASGRKFESWVAPYAIRLWLISPCFSPL